MNETKHEQPKTFTFKAPCAQRVLLAGDFTHWLAHPIPLKKNEDGIWRATTLLAPGTYHYRFYVDNEWCDDPKCKVRVRNPFGTMNNVVQVFGPRIELKAPQATSSATGSGSHAQANRDPKAR